MTWTTERIAAVEQALDATMPMAAQPHADWMVKGVLVEALYDAARIGLAAIKAEPETVERVARALATLSSPSYSEDRNWEDDLPLLRRRAKRGIRSVLDNPIGSAAAALAALKETTTPPAPPAGLPDPRG